MKQHFTDEKRGSATHCREIIICLTLHYPLRNNSQSAYGDSDICDTSSKIEGCYTPIC